LDQRQHDLGGGQRLMNSVDRFRLDGKTAVVTGALGKLGSLWCKALVGAGARVAALDLKGAQPSEAFGELQRAAGTADRLATFDVDVSARASLEQARERIGERFGGVDILVNNAGIDAPPDPRPRTFTLAEIEPQVFLRTLEVNVLGAFQCVQVFGPGMVERRRGSIINIGSLYATVSPDARLYDHIPADPPFLKPPAYGASKAALLNLTKYLSTHWGPSGVRVNALSPGGVEGGQDPEFKRKFSARVPLGRMCRLSDLEAPLLFLACDGSSYVTGIELRVDGGFTAW
jgi:NAD(P)-dependent dehydrogenase (short-subunit alcohol dehydrogenase family)